MLNINIIRKFDFQFFNFRPHNVGAVLQNFLNIPI